MLLGNIASFGFMARSTNGFDDVLVLGTWETLSVMKSLAGIDQSHQADPRRGRRVDKADGESAARTMDANKHAVSASIARP